jgi:hypothetical protein
MVLTEVETSMMRIRLVGRRIEVEVALKVPVYLNSRRRNQILSMRLPFFNISPNSVRLRQAYMIPEELNEGQLDAENEKREINRFLGWAIWHLRKKLAKRRTRAKVNNWVLQENVEPLIQHLDGTCCFHHHVIIDPEYMKNCYAHADQSRNGGWLSLVSKEFFDFGKVLLSQVRNNVRQTQWGRQGNQSIKVAAAAICKDAGTKEAFFKACTGSKIPLSVLKSLMDRIVLKVFHARAGASMDAWKRKNTGREVKGSTDAAFRADLKSKVSQTTKKAGEFQIRKRGSNMLEDDDAEKAVVAARKEAKRKTEELGAGLL